MIDSRFYGICFVILSVFLFSCGGSKESKISSDDSISDNGSEVNIDIDFEVFPYDNIWNTKVNDLPMDVNSNTYIQTIGADKNFHADFGSGLYEGAPIGIPFVVVDSSQIKVSVTFTYFDESDVGPYPIPIDAPVEGGDNSHGDRHVIVVDKKSEMLYELYNSFLQSDGSWKADSGAIFDLSTNVLRENGWTSADAAGLPIYPGLVKYDEVLSGEIKHAIRFTAPKTQKSYVWPARHYASSLTDEKYPPMGQRFRLKKDFDITSFPQNIKVILLAMQEYGIMLADNGSAWYISGSPDDRWDNDELSLLKNLTGSDFEAVDVSSLIVSDNTGQVK